MPNGREMDTIISVGQNQLQESYSLSCWVGMEVDLSTETWSSISDADGEETRRGGLGEGRGNAIQWFREMLAFSSRFFVVLSGR